MITKKNICILVLIILNFTYAFSLPTVPGIEVLHGSADGHCDWELYALIPVTDPPHYYIIDKTDARKFYFRGTAVNFVLHKNEDADGTKYSVYLSDYNHPVGSDGVLVDVNYLYDGTWPGLSHKEASFTITTGLSTTHRIWYGTVKYQCLSTCYILWVIPYDCNCDRYLYGAINFLDVIPDNNPPFFQTIDGKLIKVDTINCSNEKCTYENWYKKPVVITTNPSDQIPGANNPGSGIKSNEYRISHRQESGEWITLQNWTVLENVQGKYNVILSDENNNIPEKYIGRNIVEFRTTDNVGWVSPINSQDINFDTKGPAPVNNNSIACSLKKTPNTLAQLSGAGVENIESITVNWSPVELDYPDGGSGVYRYDVMWMYGDSGFTAPKKTEPFVTKYDINIAANNLVRGEKYTIGVRAVDNLEIPGAWTYKEITIPPGPATIYGSAIYGQPYKGEGNKPYYPVSIVLDQDASYLDLITGLRLYRTIATNTNGNITYTSPVEVTGIQQSTENNGRLKLSFTLEGSEHAHKNYAFVLCTQQNLKGGALPFPVLDTVLEYGGGYGGISIPQVLPNYFPQISVNVNKDNLNLWTYSVDNGEISNDPLDPILLGRNAFFRFYSDELNQDGKDIEGDRITSAVFEEGSTSFKDLKYNTPKPISEIVPESGNKALRVQFADSGESGVFHNTGVAYFNYDSSGPIEPAFTVYAQDHIKVLDADNGTKSNWVYISDINVTDNIESGVTSSGVRKLLIWNGNTKPQEYDFIIVPPVIDQTTGKSTIDLHGLDATYMNRIIAGTLGIEVNNEAECGYCESIPPGNLPLEVAWPVTQEITDSTLIDSRFIINMQAVDLASNASGITVQSINIDTIPPGPPADLYADYPYNEDTGNINLVLHPVPSDMVKYYYKLEFDDNTASIPSENFYTLDSNLAGIVSGNDIKLNIQVNEQWDKCIKLLLWAEDKAGNMSAYALYGNTIYSPALPSINLVRADVNDLDQNNRVFMTLVPSSDAIAHDQKLVLLNGEVPTDTYLPLVNGEFIFNNAGSGLTGHTPYSFKIVAVNQHGDYRFGSTTFSFTPPNHDVIPSALSSLKPGASAFQSSSNVSFTWNNFIDPDGDPIRYSVYCRKSTQSDYTILTPEEGISYPPLSRADFQPNSLFTGNETDGDEYDWYIEAWDIYIEESITKEGTHVRLPSSGDIGFGIDNTPPAINVNIGPITEFVNSAVLPVEITESIQLSSFKYIDSPVGGTGIPVMIPISDMVLAGNGTYRYNVPLTNEGTRRMELVASDSGGNTGSVFVTLKIDRTQPDTSAISLDLPLFNNLFVCTDGVLPVNGVSDAFSGIKGVAAYFKEDNGSVRYEEKYVQIAYTAGDTQPRNFQILFSGDSAKANGKYLVLEFQDWAGNTGEWISPSPVVMDLSAPRITRFEVLGLSQFMHSLSDITVQLEASDPKSEITGTEYAFARPDGTLASGWYSDWNGLAAAYTSPAASYTTLSYGAYMIRAQVTNAYGLRAYAESKPFTVDTTAPVFSVSILPQGQLASGQVIRIHLVGTDLESGILRWSLAIGSTPGATDISARISGNESGWIVSGANSCVLTMALPPDLTAGNYYVHVKVENLAGIIASNEGTENQVAVTDTEILIVKDNGSYTADTTRLSSAWEYRGERSVFDYRYEVYDEYDMLIASGDSGIESGMTLDNLTLVHGNTYRFRITAYFTDGSTLTGESIGITVDTTQPVFVTEGDTKDLSYPVACKSDSLFISWNGKDPESGIAKAEALVEHYNSLGEKESLSGGWIGVSGSSALLNTTDTGASMPFITGDRVYVTIRLTNGAGSITDKTTALIVIDDTPPAIPFVLDNGDIVNTQSFHSVWATWKWSTGDPESGIAKYIWTVSKIKTEAGLSSWKEEKDSTTVFIADHPLFAGITGDELHGQLWYVAVRAINNAESVSDISWSDGVRFDRTAPYISEVKLLFNGEGSDSPDKEYLNLSNASNGLALSIKAYEDIAGNIASFNARCLTWDSLAAGWNLLTYSVSKTITPQDSSGIIPLTGFELSPGLLTLFRGSAINMAEMEAEYGYTGGLVYDNTVPDVFDMHVFGTGDEFHFDWNVRETVTISPVTACKVAFVRVTDTPTEADFTDNPYGLYSYIQPKQGLGSDEYRLAIKVTDAAGNFRIVYSQGIRNDSTLPLVRFDAPIGYAPFIAKTLDTNTVASEDISGISEIQYRLGTFEEPGIMTNEWKGFVLNLGAGENKIGRTFCFPGYTGAFDSTKIRIERNLVDKQKLYLQVRAKNSQGMWSGILSSNSILIDLTPPAVPVLLVQDVTANPNLVKIIPGSFDSKDPESGITHVRFALVEDKDATAEITNALANAPSVLAANMIDSITLPGLAHQAFGYVVAQARNGAGDWSGFGISNRFTVDLLPPAITRVTPQAAYVVNELPWSLQYDIDEQASIIFKLYDSGNTLVYESTKICPEAGEYSYPLNIQDDAYETYKLIISQAEDIAGNRENDLELATIRLNAPPEIQFVEILTNPGKPYTLDASVSDPDNDGIKTYQWFVRQDGAYESLSPPLPYSGSIAFDSVFDYSSPANRETHYQVMLTVTDGASKESSLENGLLVINTQDGTLYRDETWTGDHLLTGNIYVPVGRKLTIDGASVHARNFFGRGEIFIEVRGAIAIKNNTLMFLDDEAQYPYWTGINILGTGTITDSTVSQARFGITTLSGSAVTVSGSTLSDNEIGIRAHGSTPAIDHSDFIRNTIYGIKEDATADPTVTFCRFTGNLFDYYDEELTVRKAEEIDQLKPGINVENQSVPE